MIAVHPKKQYQFALGLSNGEVVVIEPIGAYGLARRPRHAKQRVTFSHRFGVFIESCSICHYIFC